MAVTEPNSGDQDLNVAMLTLTTISGGIMEADVIVTITATQGSASMHSWLQSYIHIVFLYQLLKPLAMFMIVVFYSY